MQTYTVKFKRLKALFFKKLKRVKGDGIVEHHQSRFFILEDETRIEIPINHIFIFGKKRYALILEHMESESGQYIKVQKK